MKRCLYSIYDEKACAYANPFQMENDLTAIRAARGTMQDKNTMIYQHANDYTMYCIGTFNDATGILEPEKPLRFVIKMDTLKEAKEDGSTNEA